MKGTRYGQLQFLSLIANPVHRLGKYHFLPPGGTWNLGGTHEFWKSKGANRRIFGNLREGTEEFYRSYSKKLKSQNINLY